MSIRLTKTVPSVLGFIALAVAAPLPAANAQLLINPAGGTVLSTNDDDDVVYPGRALGFSGNFYGVAHTTVDVSSNGHLNFSGDTSLSDAPLPSGPARLAAMWDDLYVYAGQAITEKTGAGFYSVTWQVGTFNFGHVYHEFQIVWFGAPTTLLGMNFLPDDIAFVYQTVGASPWSATIGLNQGTGGFNALPGDADGNITDTSNGLIPRFPTSGQVILFRPNGAGGYIDLVFPCPGDFNKNAVVSVQDIFDFLGAYFSGCP